VLSYVLALPTILGWHDPCVAAPAMDSTRNSEVRDGSNVAQARSDRRLRNIEYALRKFFARRVTHDREDLVQETLLRYWSSKNKLTSNARPEAFALGIALNVLKQYYRSKNARARVFCATAQVEAACVGDWASRDAALTLSAPIRSLKPEQRVLLHLLYWSDYTADEASQLLAQPSASVRRQHHETKQQLRYRLECGRYSQGGEVD
jgi:RNA polymerase sigma factor (sigma-70 family)